MPLIDPSPFSDFGWGPFWTAFWNTKWQIWAATGWAVPLATWYGGAPQAALTMILLYAAMVLLVRRTGTTGHQERSGDEQSREPDTVK